jgi:hypothetical protein
MTRKISKDDKKDIFKKHLEGYLRKNNLEISSITIKDVESMKIEGVSRQIKREILRDMKEGEVNSEEQKKIKELDQRLNQLTGLVDDLLRIYDLSYMEVQFVHELFHHKDRLLNTSTEPRELEIKREDDEEVLSIKDKLSDIQSLEEQKGVSVKINQDLYKQMKEYGRSMGLSIRQIIHLGMKEMMEKSS